jgi:hypothetical protein
VLLAPSASAVRTMLAICDQYANEYSISFNSSKSKCLVVLPGNPRFLRYHLKNCIFHGSNIPLNTLTL